MDCPRCGCEMQPHVELYCDCGIKIMCLDGHDARIKEETRKGYVELNTVYDAIERHFGHVPPEIADKLEK